MWRQPWRRLGRTTSTTSSTTATATHSSVPRHPLVVVSSRPRSLVEVPQQHLLSRLLRRQRHFLLTTRTTTATSLTSEPEAPDAQQQQHVPHYPLQPQHPVQQQQPTQRSKSLRRPRNSFQIRQQLEGQLEELRRSVEEAAQSTTHTQAWRESTISTLALAAKASLISLVAQSPRHFCATDGPLAATLLETLLAQAAVRDNPALAAELVCLTIQAWCSCGAPHGLHEAEALLWKLLRQDHLFLSNRFEINTDVYNDSLAVLLSSISRQWPGSKQLPTAVLRRVDALILSFQQLVHNPTARLDWTTFGRNQILYVCLKARRPDEALQISNEMQEASRGDYGGTSYQQPNVTTYNTVLQTLSLDGRVEEIHRILTQLVTTYRQAQTSPVRAVARNAVHANHFSVMPWVTAYSRLPLDHAQRVHAGHHAVAAVQCVQTWAEEGLVDTTALQMDLVMAAVAKAWLHSGSPDTLPRLLALWQHAVTNDRGSREVVAAPRLAWTIVLALDDMVTCPSDAAATATHSAISSFWRDTEKLAHRSRGRARQAWLRWYQRVVRTRFAAGDVAAGYDHLQVLQGLDATAAAVVQDELTAAHDTDSPVQP